MIDDIEQLASDDNKEPCIICLELQDEYNIDTVASTEFITNTQCNCTYYIHETCFLHWLATISTTNIYYQSLKCLICGSSVKKRKKCRDYFSFYLSQRAQAILINNFLYILACACFLLFLYGPKS